MLMSFEEIKPKIGWNLDRSAITRGTQQSIECDRAYSSLAASLASFTDRSTVSTFDMQKSKRPRTRMSDLRSWLNHQSQWSSTEYMATGRIESKTTQLTTPLSFLGTKWTTGPSTHVMSLRRILSPLRVREVCLQSWGARQGQVRHHHEIILDVMDRSGYWRVRPPPERKLDCS